MFSFSARTQVESEGFYTLSQAPENLRSDNTNERENLSRHVSQINVGGIHGTDSPYAFTAFVVFLVVLTGGIGIYFKNKKCLRSVP